jgi:recombination protein RecA
MATAGAKKIDAVLAAINKKQGKEVVNRLGKIKDRFKTEFIPTPSLVMNIALGGGWKKGTISETAGEHQSGKTSFWIQTIALLQKNDPEAICGWLETEGSFDMDYAVNVHGVDPDRLVVWEVTDDGAEKALDILDALIRTGEMKLVVVNSVTGLTPKKEFEGEMADQNVGLQARMMSKLMRKITGIVAKTKTHVAFINQFREKVGVLHGDPRTTTGGRALAFFATQRVDFNKVKIEKSDGFTEEEAIKISFRVRKNRAIYTNPYVKGSFVAVFGKGIDQIGEIAQLAPELGICQKSGAHIYYPNKENVVTLAGVEAHWGSKAEFMRFLEEHPDVREMFFQLIMEAKDAAKVNAALDDSEVAEIEAEAAAAEEAFGGEEGEGDV